MYGLREEQAKAFVIGPNLKEEYWDTSDHAAYDAYRTPYRPWRDAGVMIRGPVIYDIARNFEESWKLLQGNEAKPANLIANALAAERSGLFEPPPAEDSRNAPKKTKPNTPFDFPRYMDLVKKSAYLTHATLWNSGSLLHALALCGSLTVLVDMLGGLVSGVLNFGAATVRDANAWSGKISESDDYAVKDKKGESGLPAQFLRTFCVKGAPVDFSTNCAFLRAAASVQNGGLIYI